MSNSKYDKRVYAGYYKRYDGKLFYVVTMAKDGVTGEDTRVKYTETLGHCGVAALQ